MKTFAVQNLYCQVAGDRGQALHLQKNMNNWLTLLVNDIGKGPFPNQFHLQKGFIYYTYMQMYAYLICHNRI